MPQSDVTRLEFRNLIQNQLLKFQIYSKKKQLQSDLVRKSTPKTMILRWIKRL